MTNMAFKTGRKPSMTQAQPTEVRQTQAQKNFNHRSCTGVLPSKVKRRSVIVQLYAFPTTNFDQLSLSVMFTTKRVA